MEKQKSIQDMVDFLICPGFAEKDGRITRCNEAAARLFLSPDMEVEPLLVTGREEYRELSSGCLCLSLSLAGDVRGAVVTVMDGCRLFLVDQEQELRELQVLALAAQELRTPLSNIMVSAERVIPAEEKSREHQGQLNRGLNQMLRLIGNMSDALRYAKGSHPETRNVTAIVSELLDKAQALAEESGLTLTGEIPQEEIYSLVDSEQLERAVYNLLSNAFKFTPAGGSVHLALTRRHQMLRLSVEDSGSGIAQGVMQNAFTRYLREPSLEDSRYGLGLGLVLVRAAAANHGGTVLLDHPGEGTRVTMTLAIRETATAGLQSPRLRVDYAGERDHGLLELSEVLPARLYQEEL